MHRGEKWRSRESEKLQSGIKRAFTARFLFPEEKIKAGNVFVNDRPDPCLLLQQSMLGVLLQTHWALSWQNQFYFIFVMMSCVSLFCSLSISVGLLLKWVWVILTKCGFKMILVYRLSVILFFFLVRGSQIQGHSLLIIWAILLLFSLPVLRCQQASHTPLVSWFLSYLFSPLFILIAMFPFFSIN